MVATESNGRWGRLVKLSLRPADAAVWGPNLNGIACQGSAACVAVGGYKDIAGGFPPMIATWSAGRWTRADRVMLPANAAAGAGQTSRFYAASCARAGSCWAVGVVTPRPWPPRRRREAVTSTGSAVAPHLSPDLRPAQAAGVERCMRVAALPTMNSE
jgi:hypothetical protein